MMGSAPAYVLALAVMIVGVVLSFLPLVPGPPVVWLGALLYGRLTNWHGIGWPGLIMLLAIALAGSTSEWWLGALVLKRSGGSPWTMVGSFVGGIAGSFLIPIPVLGTVAGALLGVLAVEWLLHRDLRRMFRSGRGYLAVWLLEIVVEVVASVLMIGLFLLVAAQTVS